jgi:hypothetical protein
VIKPIELIQSKSMKSKPLMQQLWFERAEKVVKQLAYLLSLIEFLEEVALTSHRFSELVVTLKEEKTVEANSLANKVMAFLEGYEIGKPLHYDHYDYKHALTF